jgi:sugar phosphate permease
MVFVSNVSQTVTVAKQWWAAQQMTETRYLVAFLLCIANTICYADRTNIGIAVPSFVPDKGDRGVVLSAFFYGYILTQIPAGYFASRIGVKSVLAIGVIVWTVCDSSTVLVSDSLPLLVVVRACMGCGEGVIMPSLHRFAANWFPVSERSTLVAVISSGSDLGTIAALFLSPWILKATGQWRYIFLVFGGFSTVWLPFYYRHVSSKPEQHPRISRDEKEFIVSTRSSSGRANESIPWRTLLTNQHLWAIYVAHFSFNYSWYVLLGWLPTYIHEHLGLDLKENELLAATPYICGYCGLLVGGKVSDLLIARGFRTLHVRRCMNSIASFVPALCLYLLQFSKEPVVTILLLSGALFTGRASTSGFWINMIDVGPEYAGEIMGMSNTIATVPGILGNLITGYILKQTQSWNTVFNVAALVSIFGGVVFACFSTDRNVFKRKDYDAIPFLDSRQDSP